MWIPLQQAHSCCHHCIPGNTLFMLPSTFAILHTGLQQHIMDYLSLSKLCSHFEAYLLPPAHSTSWYLEHLQEMGFPPACLDWELVLLLLQYISKSPGLCQAKQLIWNFWHYCSNIHSEECGCPGSCLRCILTNVGHTRIKPPILSH